MALAEGKRVCQVIELKAEHLEEYNKIHRNVWPSVLASLQRSHIIDYSIHFLPAPPYRPSSANIAGLLIATFKYVGTDFEGDMKRASEDEENKRWWTVTDGMQASLVPGATKSEDGGWWRDCEEVFRFEG